MLATSAVGGGGVVAVAVRRDPYALRLGLFLQVTGDQSLRGIRCRSPRATR
jgi:hypothetical protein